MGGGEEDEAGGAVRNPVITLFDSKTAPATLRYQLSLATVRRCYLYVRRFHRSRSFEVDLARGFSIGGSVDARVKKFIPKLSGNSHLNFNPVKPGGEL